MVAERNWPRATSMPAWAACNAWVRAETLRVLVIWLTTIGTSVALKAMPTRVTSRAIGIEPLSDIAVPDARSEPGRSLMPVMLCLLWHGLLALAWLRCRRSCRSAFAARVGGLCGPGGVQRGEGAVDLGGARS